MTNHGITSLIILAIFSSACATRETTAPNSHSTVSGAADIPLQSSDRVSSAKGDVKIFDTPNNNTALELTIKNLAQPEEINQDLHMYVVWQLPPDPDSQPQNMGALAVDEDDVGRFYTLTPLKNFRLFLTAENSSSVPKPTGDKLMWTDIKK